MNRTLSTLIAIAAATSMSGHALAQRHDEKPHGYDAKVAAAQAAEPAQAAQPSTGATRLVPLPLGPRAQGTAQRVKRVPVESSTPAAQSTAAAKPETKSN